MQLTHFNIVLLIGLQSCKFELYEERNTFGFLLYFLVEKNKFIIFLSSVTKVSITGEYL